MIFIIAGVPYEYVDGEWYSFDFNIHHTKSKELVSEHQTLVAIFEALRDKQPVSVREN